VERPIFKPIGTPAEELDTPALVVDLAVLDRNIDTVHSFFRQSDAKVRPHVSSHWCPAIAHKQMAAGGTVGGISVTTVGVAEVFAANGFDDIFVANEVVTPQKIKRLCALARRVTILVAVDNPMNVVDLSEAAQAANVRLKVVVDINTGLDRCGIEPGQPAVDLAQAVSRAANLEFAGLMTYEGSIMAETTDELADASRRAIQPVLDTREMVENAGIPVSVVSAGGTHNYEIAGSIPGVTEVPAGSYALMDAKYQRQLSELECAARVMATVTSVPEPGVAIVDMGQKAIGIDLAPPVLEDFPNVPVLLSAEHGRLNFEEGSNGSFDLKSKVFLIPWEIGGCANTYDYIHAVQDGELVGIWEVSARGQYR